jgi:hypothetical protein
MRQIPYLHILRHSLSQNGHGKLLCDMDSCSEQPSMMSQSDFRKNAGRWGGSDVATRHYRAAVLSKSSNVEHNITR